MTAAPIDPSRPETLTDRLLSSFPSGSYCLQSLLQLAEITETTAVPTACVECRSRPRLLVNPEFVARHAETPEKLVMLVMHELHHVMLGHTRLFPRITPLDNLVFDAVINSMLSHLLSERAYRALFIDFYSDAKFPECFLRPPVVWSPGGEVEIPRALRSRRALGALYRRLYSVPGPSYDELREALAAEVHESGVPLGILLGDHRDEDDGASSAGALDGMSPVLIEAIRDLVRKWPTTPLPVIGQSVNAMLESTRITLPPAGPHVKLAALLRRIAGDGADGPWRRLRESTTPAESPIPVLDRRSAVLRAIGMRPLLHRTAVHGRRPVPNRERVHVYLDVSGSMAGLVPALARVIVDCGDRVHRSIHLFSERVVDVSLAQLRAGDCTSTLGTSIECVAEHLAAHQIRRAVLVTDGLVGRPSAAARAALGQCTVGVGLAAIEWSHVNRRADLDGLVAHWVDLSASC